MSDAKPSRLRQPWLHFLLLGLLLVLVDRGLDAFVVAEADREIVRVDEERVRILSSEFRRLHGRGPTGEELVGAVTAWTEEELQVREARRLGLGENDLVIQRRLLDKLEVLEAGADLGIDEQIERAYALGLDHEDPIVRRRLVQRLETYWLADLGSLRPSEQAVEDFVRSRSEQYATPARVRFYHVFLRGDVSSGELHERALALRKGLVADRVAPEAGVLRGDPFLLGHDIPLRSEEELAGSFGVDLATAAFEAPIDRWSEPVESKWGIHLVWVEERRESELPPTENLRLRVLREMELLRRQETRRLALAELKQRQEIIVDFDKLRAERTS